MKVQSAVLFYFFIFIFLCVRQKSLRLIKKNIQPCQYKNISLPQSMALRDSISYSRVGSKKHLI